MIENSVQMSGLGESTRLFFGPYDDVSADLEAPGRFRIGL